jgi:hypothetical protein
MKRLRIGLRGLAFVLPANGGFTTRRPLGGRSTRRIRVTPAKWRSEPTAASAKATEAVSHELSNRDVGGVGIAAVSFVATTAAESPDRRRGVMLQRSIMIAALMLLATPAAAGWTLPCLFSGCSITFVSPEYAAKPVQPLNPEAALAQINAYRTKNGRKPVVLDERLSRAAATQSKAQAGRQPHRSRWVRWLEAHATRRACWLSSEDRLGECRLRSEIVQRRHAQLGRKLGPSGEPVASRGDRCWCGDGKEQ